MGCALAKEGVAVVAEEGAAAGGLYTAAGVEERLAALGGEAVHVTVRTLSGKALEVTVPGAGSVYDLKCVVFNRLEGMGPGAPSVPQASHIRLMVGATVLSNAAVLETIEGLERVVMTVTAGEARTNPPLGKTVREELRAVSASNQDDEVHRWQSIAVPKGVARARLCLTWKDQGFGYTKGRVAMRVCSPARPRRWTDLMGSVNHDWHRREWTLPPAILEDLADGGALELGYRVGGGGGHELFITDAEVFFFFGGDGDRGRAASADGSTVRLPYIAESGVDSEVHPWQSVKVPEGTARAVLHLWWQDQGNGNRQGRITARVTRDGAAVTDWTDVLGIAPHFAEEREEALPPPVAAALAGGGTLELGYVVGGGGGHELLVMDASVTFAAGGEGGLA